LYVLLAAMNKIPETYVAILRGINVSGKNIIRMDELQAMFLSMGFSDVRTYIQSGNVVFRSKGTARDFPERKISDRIRQDFGFEVPVIVRNSGQMKQIISENPFLAEKDILTEKLHVTYLSEAPAKERTDILKGRAFPPAMTGSFFPEQRSICTVLTDTVIRNSPTGFLRPG
jgi:uncharacterized protein (DUF1697 family)